MPKFQVNFAETLFLKYLTLSFWKSSRFVFVVLAFLNFQFFGEGIDFCFDGSKEGHRLDSNVSKYLRAQSGAECILQCLLQDKSCRSVNFKKISVGEEKLEDNCELLHAVYSEQNGSLRADKHYDYYILLQPNRSQRKLETQEIPSKPSCKELLDDDRSLSNGAYTLQSDNSAPPYKVYCQMTDIPGCGSGGWTLVLTVDGNKPTFNYDSSYWTNNETYAVENGLEGLTEKESKLASYWNTPFKKICLGMAVNGDRKWIMLKYEASSLHSLIADGQYRPTNISLDSFKSLISSLSLQPHCNRQGFNNNLQNPSGPYYAFIRLGLLANNENDCNTCDSWIGFGAKYRGCGTNVLMASGNRAVCVTNSGNVNIPAFGYILVQ